MLTYIYQIKTHRVVVSIITIKYDNDNRKESYNRIYLCLKWNKDIITYILLKF